MRRTEGHKPRVMKSTRMHDGAPRSGGQRCCISHAASRGEGTRATGCWVVDYARGGGSSGAVWSEGGARMESAAGRSGSVAGGMTTAATGATMAGTQATIAWHAAGAVGELHGPWSSPGDCWRACDPASAPVCMDIITAALERPPPRTMSDNAHGRPLTCTRNCSARSATAAAATRLREMTGRMRIVSSEPSGGAIAEQARAVRTTAGRWHDPTMTHRRRAPGRCR